MNGLWTPPTVSRELQEGTARYRAELIEQARTDATVNYWTGELKKLDPYLEMIRARRGATLMREGFYYILRHNPGAPPSLTCVEGPDGGFVEPDSGVFEMLRRSDMWNGEAQRDRRRLREEAERAKERRQQTERAARLEELAERWKAATRTQVSMNRDAPWAQNAAGARRRGR